MQKKYKSYIIQILTALLVGALSAFFTSGKFNLFSNIVKPPLSPPFWVFPIVWTILFILMGISAAIFFNKRGHIPAIYWAQLFVNFVWPLLFFNMEAYLFAFIWIVFLVILVITMIITFYATDKKAGLLQIPYLVWIIFAGYLNFAIWLMNK